MASVRLFRAANLLTKTQLCFQQHNPAGKFGNTLIDIALLFSRSIRSIFYSCVMCHHLIEESPEYSCVYSLHTRKHIHVYTHTCVKYFNINVSRELKNRKEEKKNKIVARIVYDLEANFNAIGL